MHLSQAKGYAMAYYISVITNWAFLYITYICMWNINFNPISYKLTIYSRCVISFLHFKVRISCLPIRIVCDESSCAIRSRYILMVKSKMGEKEKVAWSARVNCFYRPTSDTVGEDSCRAQWSLGSAFPFSRKIYRILPFTRANYPWLVNEKRGKEKNLRLKAENLVELSSS